LLRYHAPENWETVREGLVRMGRADLIGSSDKHLISSRAPVVAITPASRIKTGRVTSSNPRSVAPKMNTYGNKPAAHVKASAPISTARPALAFRSAKAKPATVKTGRK
jgi:hypothetical protein